MTNCWLLIVSWKRSNTREKKFSLNGLYKYTHTHTHLHTPNVRWVATKETEKKIILNRCITVIDEVRHFKSLYDVRNIANESSECIFFSLTNDFIELWNNCVCIMKVPGIYRYFYAACFFFTQARPFFSLSNQRFYLIISQSNISFLSSWNVSFFSSPFQNN